MHTTALCSRALAPFLVSLAAATSLVGQCGLSWSPGAGVPGATGPIYSATAWDPDGPGPATARVVLGGFFKRAGQLNVSNLAIYDPATRTWSTPPGAPTGPVDALLGMKNGDLIVGGRFNAAGSVLGSIARWDGTSWSALGSGIPYSNNTGVYALAELSNGDLAVGGELTTAGGVAVNHLARWDGSNWSNLGGGVSGSSLGAVYALHATVTGDLIVGGSFTTAGGGQPASNVVLWNGTSWSTFGSGADQAVYDVSQALNGDLYIAGLFTMVNGVAANYVARFDGTAWSSLASGMDWLVDSITPLATGDVLAGGSFALAGGTPAARLARWSGGSWSAVGVGFDRTQADRVFRIVEMPGGDVYVAGRFPTVNGHFGSNVVRLVGNEYEVLGTGIDNHVLAVATLSGGDAVYGGRFSRVGDNNTPANHIAQWDGASWSALGNGVDGAVHALASGPAHLLVAGGDFVTAGTTSAHHVAQWDGAAWSSLGQGLDDRVNVVLPLATGEVIAGGEFLNSGGTAVDHIARWDGAAWQPLGLGVDGAVHDLEQLPNGDIVAVGSFSTAGGLASRGAARWDGTAWHRMGGGMQGAGSAVILRPDGDLFIADSYVIGSSIRLCAIRRWNGNIWIHIVTFDDYVYEFANLPNGDLLAGGFFTNAGGVPARNLARYSGSTWSTYEGGISDRVEGLAFSSKVGLAVGGWFHEAGAQRAAFAAQLTTPCPAGADPVATACVGSVGPLTLSATKLPWIGATFESSVVGFAPGSLALSIMGLSSQSLPLAQLHPTGRVGCDLLAQSDAVVFLLPSSGASGITFGIPPSVGLAGVTLHHQFVQGELTAQGQLLALSSSNALTLTVGAF